MPLSSHLRFAFLIRAFVCALALTLFAASPTLAQPDRAAEAAAELERLRGRIEALRTAMEADLSRRDDAQTALRSVERTLASQAAVLRELDQAISTGARRLSALEETRAQHQRTLEAERAALAGLLRAAYATGRQERLRLLLNQDDPALVGRMLVYYDHLNRTRLARIQRIDNLVEQLDSVAADIVAERDRLEERRAAQANALAQVERARGQRAQVLAALERQLRSRGAELSRLQADEAALQRLLESLNDLLADVPADLGERRAFNEQRGQLGWPTTGRVLARFGEARDDAGRWRGLLIGANEGSPVRAVAYGRVAWAGWMPHFGNLMVIEHGDGWYSLYGHTRTMLREVGAWVDAGTVIAEVGDSGGQPRPALYFELRRGRDPVNPQPWLVSR